jgi:hypothetical protein
MAMTPARAGRALTRLTGLRLLIPLPPLRVRSMLLTAREPVHPVPHQDAMHGRHSQRPLMKPFGSR